MWVHQADTAVTIYLSLRKVVIDARTKDLWPAATWYNIITATVPGDRHDHVLLRLSESLDRFLVTYQSVNEVACGGTEN